ncbi:hypothetical protein SVAN01_06329 [Stagonosporopsis vannaccii]|nr:hypothetical protein SVAN01_06329 [Stagonosporopsis vannaccii]
MDTSRSPSASRSRRSYPNLHNLSLAPLSSKYPLDASSPPSPVEHASGTQTPRTSYIAQKSAPTTPGILSLSQSRSTSRHTSNRRLAQKPFAYDGYFAPPRDDVRDAGDIPKAKSTNTLLPGVSFQEPSAQLDHKRHHARKATAPLPLRTPLHRHHTSEGNDEWLHRAGLVIAGETRDARGQGWLVRRESSTSLMSSADPPGDLDARYIARLSGEPADGVEFPTFSPRISRAASRLPSRVGSRVHSARQSRRGSRVGSRIDLAMSGLPSARASLDMEDESAVEPDFVEADDDGPDDEEEVARLARERGFGLGGWMDALIGWTLFSVDEDDEVSSDDEEEASTTTSTANLTKDEAKLMREVEAKRRKMERESIIAASALKVQDKNEGGEVKIQVPKPPEGQEAGGWQDAAWLLSVASKALF